VVSYTETLASSLFNLIFPDDCRLCEEPLKNVSRIPVCVSCLRLPQPLQADYFCRVCRTPFVDSYPLDENDLCTVCRKSLVNFDTAYSFGSYEGSLQKLIQLFKYGKVESLAGPLSRLLLQSLPFGENFDVILAMPMHWRKQWERGFNQAELLAEPVARRFHIKLSHNLVRARYTKAQAGLNEQQRQENLKDSLFVKRPVEISGKRVLLIDDVFTTGASLRAAAAALKASGASHVTALTLARVDHRSFVRSAERSRLTASGRARGFDASSALYAEDGRKSQTAVLEAK
jgi:competence protein ComFC